MPGGSDKEAAVSNREPVVSKDQQKKETSSTVQVTATIDNTKPRTEVKIATLETGTKSEELNTKIDTEKTLSGTNEKPSTVKGTQPIIDSKSDTTTTSNITPTSAIASAVSLAKIESSTNLPSSKGPVPPVGVNAAISGVKQVETAEKSQASKTVSSTAYNGPTSKETNGKNPAQISTASSTNTDTHSLVLTSQIDQIPQNVLTLLQTFGPLTLNEISYNLPTPSPSIPAILDVMIVLGVIHFQDGLYYFHNGEIRGESIYPNEIIGLIQDTQNEINETKDRIEMLKQELNKDVDMNQRARSTREFLKTLVGKYDSIRGDPVYSTALKTLNVDLGMKRKMVAAESAKKKLMKKQRIESSQTSAKVSNSKPPTPTPGKEAVNKQPIAIDAISKAQNVMTGTGTMSTTLSTESAAKPSASNTMSALKK